MHLGQEIPEAMLCPSHWVLLGGTRFQFVPLPIMFDLLTRVITVRHLFSKIIYSSLYNRLVFCGELPWNFINILFFANLSIYSHVYFYYFRASGFPFYSMHHNPLLSCLFLCLNYLRTSWLLCSLKYSLNISLFFEISNVRLIFKRGCPMLAFSHFSIDPRFLGDENSI